MTTMIDILKIIIDAKTGYSISTFPTEPEAPAYILYPPDRLDRDQGMRIMSWPLIIKATSLVLLEASIALFEKMDTNYPGDGYEKNTATYPQAIYSKLVYMQWNADEFIAQFQLDVRWNI